MLLLHLSDIHFKHTVCDIPHIDPNTHYRNALVSDVKDMADEIGSSVDAILVTGDIAFSGNPKEYAAALKWLTSLADASGCKRDRILVVPGNHDVDRDVVIKNPAVRDSQAAIRAKTINRDDELWKKVGKKLRGQVLFAPIKNYNNFAANFECQHYFPKRTFWHQDLPLDDSGTVVRIFGLTSTFLSGPDDAPNRLYLSGHQTVFYADNAAVTIAMCHHPPDWLIDGDDADEILSDRVTIHLFGHKHRQRFIANKNYLRFMAGAVCPDRDEAGWEPGYNLIDLSMVDDGINRYLDVRAHLRIWQSNPGLFIAKQTASRETVFSEKVAITKARASCAPSAPLQDEPFTTQLQTLPSQLPEMNVEAAMSDERTRNIYFRLWDLSLSKRRTVFNKFSLLDSSDAIRSDAEKCRKALLNASNRGILQDVVDEIEKMERR